MRGISPARSPVRDAEQEITWRQLDETTDRIAASLIALGIQRDARVLVQIPSSSREMVLRDRLQESRPPRLFRAHAMAPPGTRLHL